MCFPRSSVGFWPTECFTPSICFRLQATDNLLSSPTYQPFQTFMEPALGCGLGLWFPAWIKRCAPCTHLNPVGFPPPEWLLGWAMLRSCNRFHRLLNDLHCMDFLLLGDACHAPFTWSPMLISHTCFTAIQLSSDPDRNRTGFILA